MKLNSGIDSGPILSQKEVNIAKNETCEDLTTRLFSLSSKILIEVINKIEKGKITQKEQCEKEATYTKKLSRLDGLINWENSASEISNMIRAYHPWPGSYTVLNGRKLKIIESEFLISKHIKNSHPAWALGSLLSTCVEVVVSSRFFQTTKNHETLHLSQRPKPQTCDHFCCREKPAP